MKKIKYILLIIVTALLTINITDYFMLQRFKSICKQEMELINKEDAFSNENDKLYNDLFSEKETIVAIWNNPIWNFLSFIPK